MQRNNRAVIDEYYNWMNITWIYPNKIICHGMEKFYCANKMLNIETLIANAWV